MTSEVLPEEDLPKEWIPYISKTGRTYTIDFMIGEEKFLGQGLAAPTLKAFTQFIKAKVDSSVDTFIIDPAESNPRAKHVYANAGFETVAEFLRDDGYFRDIKHFLMIKKLDSLKNAFKFVPLSSQTAKLPELIALAIGSPTPEKVQKILDAYDEPDCRLLGCYSENRLVGLIGLQVNETHGVIKHIAVLKSYRNQGIGKALITEAIPYLNSKHAQQKQMRRERGFMKSATAPSPHSRDLMVHGLNVF